MPLFLGYHFSVILLLLPSILLANLTTNSSNNLACTTAMISENEVFEFVAKKLGENNKMRPRLNWSEPVVISISLNIYGVKDFNVQENKLTISGFLEVSWTDDFFRWDSDFPYNCLDGILIDLDKLWQPDLAWILGKMEISSSAFVHNDKAWVYNDGRVEIYPIGDVSTGCNFDITLFPFDFQLCHIVLESWNYESTKQKLVLADPAFTRLEKSWIEHGMWAVSSNSSQNFIQAFADDPNTYEGVTFTLLLTRKPEYYYINIIVPCILIASVEIVSFVLPIREVGRVQISFSCLLAFTFFQDIVISEVPRSSQSRPLLTSYIYLQVLYIAVIAIFGEILVFYFIKKSKTRVEPPGWLISTSRALGRLFFVDDDYFKKVADNQAKQWLLAAQVSVRINMFLYIAATVVTPVLVLWFLPPSQMPKLNKLPIVAHN